MVPTNWIEAPQIQKKAADLNIPEKLYNRELDKFRKSYYRVDESLNHKFWKILVKAFETHKNRSRAQKARHHKRPEYTERETPPARDKSSHQFAKQQIKNIRQSIKVI